MAKKKRNKAQEKTLAAAVGQGRAEGLKWKEMFGAGDDAAVAKKMFRKGALKAGLRGAITGAIQAEVLEGKYKKAKQHVKTGKRVIDMFKNRKK